MEYWSNGMLYLLEGWSIGVLGKAFTPLFQHSIAPFQNRREPWQEKLFSHSL